MFIVKHQNLRVISSVTCHIYRRTAETVEHRVYYSSSRWQHCDKWYSHVLCSLSKEITEGRDRGAARGPNNGQYLTPININR